MRPTRLPTRTTINQSTPSIPLLFASRYTQMPINTLTTMVPMITPHMMMNTNSSSLLSDWSVYWPSPIIGKIAKLIKHTIMTIMAMFTLLRVEYSIIPLHSYDMSAPGALVIHPVDELELVVPTSWACSDPEVTGSLMDRLHTPETPQFLFQKLREVDPAV